MIWLDLDPPPPPCLLRQASEKLVEQLSLVRLEGCSHWAQEDRWGDCRGGCIGCGSYTALPASQPFLQFSSALDRFYPLLPCARPELVNSLLRTFLAGAMDPPEIKSKGEAAGFKACRDGSMPRGIAVHAVPAGKGTATSKPQQ